MLKKNYRFESKVHLGFLLIIFLLLLLNFVSNYVLYKAKASQKSELYQKLNSSARAISRVVQDQYPQPLEESRKIELIDQYDLSDLMLVPWRPPDNTLESRRKWFTLLAQEIPPENVSKLAGKLLTSDFNTLAAGEGSEYFHIYPIPAKAGHNVLILSTHSNSLAYLDSTANVIMLVVVASLFFVALLYLLLSRYIFRPYRQMTAQAELAGRDVDGSEDEPDAVVKDYQKIIEELKQSEKELRRLNEKIQNKAETLEQFNDYLLASIHSGIITLNLEGKILSINRAAMKILNIQDLQLTDSSFEVLFSKDTEIGAILTSVLEENGDIPDYQEYQQVTLKGRLTLGMVISPIKNHERNQIGFSILLNDLTEINRLREELQTRRQLAMLGEMSGGLAHQLRNSMGAISGYCNLLKKRTRENLPDENSIDALVKETQEAEKLINQFLDFTRPFNMNPEAFDLVKLIEDIIEAYHVRNEMNKIRFVSDMPKTVKVTADPVLIKQTLTNLIDNAANAYPEGQGEIKITLEPGDEFTRVTIEDNGCGIEAAALDQIFTPFYSTRPQGSGLGLPLAAKIIDLHGGRLTVESRPGQGTTFTVILPNQVSDTMPGEIHVEKTRI